MSLAFLILAHKHAGQVERLFQAIYRSDDILILHFDRRADRRLRELGARLTAAHRNVTVLEPRAILWGGYRMAEVQMEAMRTALGADANWHHFINLTGQDFPLKPVEEIDEQLSHQPDANYVSWFDPVATGRWKNARERVLRYHLEWPWLDRVLRIPGIGRRLRAVLGWTNQLPHLPRYRRPWPSFRYLGGSNHVILSRAGCEHLCHAPAAQAIKRWIRRAGHANEIVFQSVLLNSPLASTIVNTDLREVDFPLHAPHPRTFTSADLPRLLASEMLFARKFDPSVDPDVLEVLGRHLEHRRMVRKEGAHP